jgi:hypothetical protein
MRYNILFSWCLNAPRIFKFLSNFQKAATMQPFSTLSLKRVLLAASVCILSACGGGGSDSAAGGTTALAGTVKGIALDAKTGAPLSGVTVSVGTNKTTTISDGSYTLTGLSDASRSVVKFENAGYAPAFGTVSISQTKAVSYEAHLSPVDATASVSSTSGGTVTVAGSVAQVTLPANGFVDSTGTAATGAVTVKLAVINPKTNPASMPGDYTDSTGAKIESFGALSITLESSTGAKLNLANGKTATIRIPAVGAGTLPATIPLYYYNETTGNWVQEGSATLMGVAGAQYYEGTVSHFTVWNADQVMNTVYINGCLNTANGAAATAQQVKGVGVDYLGSAVVTTDAQGKFRLPVKINGTVNVYAPPTGSKTNVVVGATDITMPACISQAVSSSYAVTLTSVPASTSVVVGQTAVFSVIAACSNPVGSLTYQWYRNGVAISGATADVYVTPVTSLADSGAVFTVQAIHSSGLKSPVTAGATLTVTPVPATPTITISTQPSSTSVIAGGTATFGVNASVSNNATETYQWYLNGTAISGATQSSYTTPVLTVANSGAQYTVKISSAGLVTVTSSVATLTVTAAPVSNATALEQIKIALLSAGIANGAIDAFNETLSSGNVVPPGCNTGSVVFRFDNVLRTVGTQPVIAVSVGQHSLSAVYTNCLQSGNSATDTDTENGTTAGTYNFSSANGGNLNGTGVVTFTNRSSKNNTTNTIGTINGNTNLTSTESNSSSTQTVSGNQIMTVATSSSRVATPVSGTVQFVLGGGGASGSSSYVSGSSSESYTDNYQYNATTSTVVLNASNYSKTYNNLTSTVGMDTYVLNGTLSQAGTTSTNFSGGWTISRNGVVVGTISIDNNLNFLVTINGATSVLSSI